MKTDENYCIIKVTIQVQCAKNNELLCLHVKDIVFCTLNLIGLPSQYEHF